MKKYLFLLFLFTLLPFASYAGITEETLNLWSQEWENLGEIPKSHLNKQYDESIQLYDHYRKKRKGDYGYDVQEGFDPNETHIETLFELKVPMLYGYAHQLIVKNFKEEEQTSRLAALKGLIREADTLNTENTPHFSLLAFKSLNILTSYLASQSDTRGDIWRYIIKDPIIYEYFKKISLDKISLNEYVTLVKKRANELRLTVNSIERDELTPRAAPEMDNLTLWYYFIPYLGFETYLYYPSSLLPLETLWNAHYHEIGVSVIGDGDCSIHGSTINNTFNMFLHDLFHWSTWTNRTKLNERLYRDINMELQSYLLSCIDHPLTDSTDNFHDLAVYFFLVHEDFYYDAQRDRFIRSIFTKEELTKLLFGIKSEEDAIPCADISHADNFKRFLGNARIINKLKGLELSTKTVWLLKKLNWLLNEEVYKNLSVNASNISLTEFSEMDNERDEITAKFKYTVIPVDVHPVFYEVTPCLNGKLTISPVEGDQFNLKVKIELTNENEDFIEMDQTILNYRYTRKNYADDYYNFLVLLYPHIYKELSSGVEAEPSIVSEGLDRLLVDFYERHKNKFEEGKNTHNNEKEELPQ